MKCWIIFLTVSELLSLWYYLIVASKFQSVQSYKYLYVCLHVLKGKRVQQKDSPAQRECSVSVVIAARSLRLRPRLQRAAGGETLLLYLSSCSCLWSPSLLCFSLPFHLRQFRIVLLCPSGALSPMYCHCRCVRVCVGVTDQVAVHIWSRRSLQVPARIPCCRLCLIKQHNTSLSWCRHNLCLHAWPLFRC